MLSSKDKDSDGDAGQVIGRVVDGGDRGNGADDGDGGGSDGG